MLDRAMLSSQNFHESDGEVSLWRRNRAGNGPCPTSSRDGRRVVRIDSISREKLKT